ncbi:MAG: DUF6125 family protein [Desulfosarcinaceae bacterium]|jgi:hypothetical protein
MANRPTIWNLESKDKARFIMDMFHRTIVHYALWFTEVRHQMGMEKALDALAEASQRSWGIQLKRLGKVLGFDLQEGVPQPLLDLSDEKLDELTDAAAINWLANDGVWFQAVEFSAGMNDAKRCNDSCWAHFSPVEAWSIKRFLGLGERPGLEGLKQALAYRLYACINTQSISDETQGAFTFQMNQCRVQNARKRKGLEDYPCKSAGLVEYAYFARAIDDRIQTECLGCPPDPHPEAWFCAWRFSLDG